MSLRHSTVTPRVMGEGRPLRSLRSISPAISLGCLNSTCCDPERSAFAGDARINLAYPVCEDH